MATKENLLTFFFVIISHYYKIICQPGHRRDHIYIFVTLILFNHFHTAAMLPAAPPSNRKRIFDISQIDARRPRLNERLFITEISLCLQHPRDLILDSIILDLVNKCQGDSKYLKETIYNSIAFKIDRLTHP